MVSKGKKQEKAPKSCQECEHWTEVRNKLRVGDGSDSSHHEDGGQVKGSGLQAFAGGLT